MIYQCGECSRTTFETVCPWCATPSSPSSVSEIPKRITPLDPSFYPDFQYQSKGLLKDILGRKKEQAHLDTVLNDVLRKYAELRKPYFINFVHTTREQGGVHESDRILGARMDGEYSELELFREVLIRKGFNELEGFPLLLDKLLLTTAFGSVYAGFSADIVRHIKPSLRETVTSWIEESGTTFRTDLSMFFFFLWENEFKFPEVEYDQRAAEEFGIPLLSLAKVKSFLAALEKINFDILVGRLASQLEHFNPNNFVNMYAVDAMDGYQFEDFLVEIFRTIGYDVTETKRSADQGADLFVNRFGKNIVIQAKNYSGSVGNSAVQQAISAKAFYGCDEAMVVTNSYFTKSAKDLAASALVRLIDRVELQGYLDDYNQKIIAQFEMEDLDIDIDLDFEDAE